MKKILLITVSILLFAWLFVYSTTIEPNKLEVKTVEIEDTQLSGLKVLFLGDFHIAPKHEKRLQKIVEAMNEQEPDLILSVGDFVKGHTNKSTMPIEIIAKELGKAKSQGFYTVLGNHDTWIYGNEMIPILEKNNIKVLHNSNIKLRIKNKDLYIAGIADLVTDKADIPLAMADTQKPVIFLTHNPDAFVKLKSDVNLVLAGHTHGGQIRLPLVGALLVPSQYKFEHGIYENETNKMIVTKGLGNSILPVRFNCVPEMIVIKFK